MDRFLIKISICRKNITYSGMKYIMMNKGIDFLMQ